MDVCTQQRQEMKVSPNFVYTKHLSKRELWTETIEVWDYLVEAGYNPETFPADWSMFTLRDSLGWPQEQKGLRQ